MINQTCSTTNLGKVSKKWRIILLRVWPPECSTTSLLRCRSRISRFGFGAIYVGISQTGFCIDVSETISIWSEKALIYSKIQVFAFYFSKVILKNSRIKCVCVQPSNLAINTAKWSLDQAFHRDVTVPRIYPGSDQIFAKYQGLDPGHDLLLTPW